ncbi:MAG: hypothetical protein HYX68_00205 [Planctomycetes bacterium]|nr:hypothetical protein [Planctomycetota bacterium]
MAQEHSTGQAKPAWTKIFSAFKIALDMKKLVLAAAGIFLAWLGWCLLGWTFHGMRAFPVHVIKYDEKADPEVLQSEWRQFKANRHSWNLLHELAGSLSDRKMVDAGDVTDDLEEFKLLHEWSRGYEFNERLNDPVVIGDVKEKDATLDYARAGWKFKITAVDKKGEGELPNLAKAKLTLRSIKTVEQKDGDKVNRIVVIAGDPFNVEGPFEKLKDLREGALDLAEIQRRANADRRPVAIAALLKFRDHLIKPKTKPAGLLRVSPWFEDRGGNPYLLVANGIKTRGQSVFGNGRFFTWFFSEEAPVLLEPLYKFLTPIVYFFDARATFWDRFYLILVMLWTVAVWGFFGGAIARIAAVQIARGERITLKEAILFMRERFVSYVAAPVFPMALVAILTLVLVVFGWVEWIPILGDVFAGLFWPVVILVGFIMAIVLVGLIGWPLMIATVSTEGTDSFDALSRSYSYIYQAPWQYLWYNFLAIVYGAALVFFIGFMASLMIFLGKWGVSSAPGLAGSKEDNDREPSYLAYYAPTSFGWRDLLIGSNPFTETKVAIAPDGRTAARREFTPEYEKNITWYNRAGAFLVAVWLWVLFLLVVGFGYSYFWSSSTIIYFLMRQYVDDTDLEEVHQEDDDLNDAFLKPVPAAAPAPPAGKPGTVSLTVVEAPPPEPMPPPIAEPAPPPGDSPPPNGDGRPPVV